MKYFIYFLLDLRKPGKFIYNNIILNYEPFYVGISKRLERLDDHFYFKHKGVNPLKERIMLKLRKLNFKKNEIGYIFKTNLNETQAIELEKEIIKKIGRRNLKKGPLTNLDNGGIGGNGEHWKNKKHTDKTKQKIKNTIGDSRKGKLNSNFGNKWSDIQKKEASKRQKENHKHLKEENNPAKRKEVRKKLSKSKTGLKNPNASKWELISPSGDKFIIEGGIKKNIKKFGVDYQTFKKDSDKPIRKNLQGWILIKVNLQGPNNL